MRSQQCESGCGGMVEAGGLPAVSLMAIAAGGAATATMNIVGSVARHALLRRAGKAIACVAAAARCAGMLAAKRKACSTVIETYLRPGSGTMAGAAVLAQLASVSITLKVTVDALVRRGSIRFVR